ncbi:TetR/AcrR family transcriptional regulator C-terminal domain-containing protein [soil metagenome]
MAVQPAKPEPRDGRDPLSRERVLAAALELADAEGIEGLSMRRLGAGLGVEAMSLYHWFASKDELLAAMLDVVYDEIEVPPIDGDWREPMRLMAISFHDTLLRHRWACGLLMSSFDLSEPRMRQMDAVLARLREGGLSDTLIDHAYHALDSYIVGFTLWQLPIIAISKELPDLAEQVMARLPREQYPDLVAHMEYHMAPRAEGERAFEFGLDLLLGGLERLRRGA